MGRKATHEERIASVITEGQILYCASEEDRERWNVLKARAWGVSDKNSFIDMAEDVIKEICSNVVTLKASHILRYVQYLATLVKP